MKNKIPSEEELQVLQEAKTFYGRSWRSVIQTAWVNGGYKGFPKSHLLQSMRNNPQRGWNLQTVKI